MLKISDLYFYKWRIFLTCLFVADFYALIGSSQNVQVLWLLFYKAAESGFQWDSLPLAKFDAMNHDHESAARYLEEITER